MGRLRGVIWMNPSNEGEHFTTGLGRKMQLSPFSPNRQDPAKEIYSAWEWQFFSNRIRQFVERNLINGFYLSGQEVAGKQMPMAGTELPERKGENWAGSQASTGVWEANAQGEIQSANLCLGSTKGLASITQLISPPACPTVDLTATALPQTKNFTQLLSMTNQL